MSGRFIRDEAGLSPVIGVVLLVAITTVTAATIFLVVNNLNAGSSGVIPFLKLETERNSAVEWKLQVIAASPDLHLSEFVFLLTRPDGGIVEVRPGDAFAPLYGKNNAGTNRLDIAAANTTVLSCATNPYGAWRFALTDANGNDRLSSPDLIAITYSTGTDAPCVFDDAWLQGNYKFQAQHRASGGIAFEARRSV